MSRCAAPMQLESDSYDYTLSALLRKTPPTRGKHSRYPRRRHITTPRQASPVAVPDLDSLVSVQKLARLALQRSMDAAVGLQPRDRRG